MRSYLEQRRRGMNQDVKNKVKEHFDNKEKEENEE